MNWLRQLLWFVGAIASMVMYVVIALRNWPFYLAVPFLAFTMFAQAKLFLDPLFQKGWRLWK